LQDRSISPGKKSKNLKKKPLPQQEQKSYMPEDFNLSTAFFTQGKTRRET
jgi:hypothetical protein